MPNYRYSSTEYMRRSQSPQPCRQASPQSCPQTRVNASAYHCDQPCAQNEPKACTQTTRTDCPPCPPVLAMAYVKWQEWQYLYEPDKGLSRGTIFEELDKPFKGRGGCCK